MNRSVIAACFALFVFILVSCKPQQEKDLVNYWRLCESKNSARDSVRTSFEKAIELMEQNVDSIKDATQKLQFVDDLKNKRSILERNENLSRMQMDSSFLEISINGLYDCNLMGMKETGSWFYDKSKTEFVSKPAGTNKENRLKVMRVSSDSLMLGNDNQNYMMFYSTHPK